MQSISSCLSSPGACLSSTGATIVQYAESAGHYIVLAGQYSVNGVIAGSQYALEMLQTAGLAIANLASRVWQQALPIIQQLGATLTSSATTVSQFVWLHRTNFIIAVVALVIASAIAYLCANCCESEDDDVSEAELNIRDQRPKQQEITDFDDRKSQQTGTRVNLNRTTYRA